MQPAIGEQGKALGLKMDRNGFVVSEPDKGMIAAGCARSAADVYTCTQSGTAAALKAIQTA
jgi:quinone-modifying oxidoreductase subunit QmoA